MTFIEHCFTSCLLSHFSRVQLFATAWTGAHQAPLAMGFSRQEYWRGLPCLLQGIFPSQGSNLRLLCFLNQQAGRFFTTSISKHIFREPRVIVLMVVELKFESKCVFHGAS